MFMLKSKVEFIEYFICTLNVNEYHDYLREFQLMLY